jgi:hypothetical protein
MIHASVFSFNSPGLPAKSIRISTSSDPPHPFSLPSAGQSARLCRQSRLIVITNIKILFHFFASAPIVAVDSNIFPRA